MSKLLQRWPFLHFLCISLQAAASSTSSDHSSAPFPFSPGFDIKGVSILAESLPSHSWEFGTAAETLLELYEPEHSIYGKRPFPVPTINPDTSRSLTYARKNIVIGIPPNGLSDGDGAVGDPASLGVSAILLGKTNKTYAIAAASELDYLLAQAPRWPNGAISHRAQYAELWADFMYMAPPFMAYYGVAQQNATILADAVDQCILYRNVLLANTTSVSPTPPMTHPTSADGLWTHILGPVNNDPGIWSTGNAWAAAGAMRVLATLIKAPSSLFSGKIHTAQWRKEAASNLCNLIRSILNAAMKSSLDRGLIRNYIDDTTWFGEISGSNLLASVAFRLATLSHNLDEKDSLLSSSEITKYVSWAEKIRSTMATSGHITSNGTATPAVNPLGWGDDRS